MVSELNDDDMPMTPSRLLAKRVGIARNKANETLRDVAKATRFDSSYIHRVESGKVPPSDNLTKALDKHWDTDGLLTDLLQLLEHSAVPDPGAVNRSLKDAARIQVLTSTVVPGLLQTEEYARELVRVGQVWDNYKQLDEWVRERMRRQRILKGEQPPFFWAIVDEAVLKRTVGGIECMGRQIAHILAAIESPYVTVQLLPFTCGAHSIPGGTATLVTARDGSLRGYAEGVMVGAPIESPARLIKLTKKFDVARSKALPEEESKEVIVQYAKDYDAL